jgi:hypothetical protein
MATTVADPSGLLKGIPAGVWAAISEQQHKVIAFGAGPQAVLAEARKKGEKLPLIVRVPEQNLAMFL